jgi:hypothetical protein
MCWYVKDGPLLDFLYKVAKDPVACAAYRQDPEQALRKSGLSHEHIALLLDGDGARILGELTGRHCVDQAETYAA